MNKSSPIMTQLPIKIGLTSKQLGSTPFAYFTMPSILLVLMTIAGCASQTEMIRMQGQVVELQKQLEYEKQRLKQATEKAGPGADQNAGQPPL